MSEVLIRGALETSLRVTAVAALVALVLLAARVRSSSVRHAAWVAVLVAMVLMPVPYCVPAVGVPVPAPALRSMDALTGFVSPFGPPPDPADVVSRGEPARIASAPAGERPVRIRAVPVATARGPLWPSVVVAIYALGLVLLASRLFVGWRRARRLVENRLRESFSIQNDVESRVPAGKRLPESIFVSALVVTPLTVGVLSPRIILPIGWRAWPAEKLQAVLAHERAHVARRDPLIAFIAALNRCVFWFHPLAWWLERTLATMAEHACDEAAVRELGERRSAAYAEVLLDMAEAARQAGGRLTWQGIGVVNGTSLIGRRVDRILRCNLLLEVSGARKLLVALGCATAIVIGAACRQQPAPPPSGSTQVPMQQSPGMTSGPEPTKSLSEEYKTAWAMSGDEVAALQGAWERHPEDLSAAKKLLLFYEPVHEGVTMPNHEQFIPARRAILLWLVEHHPDNLLAGRSRSLVAVTTLPPPAVATLPDDAGAVQARSLWLSAIARPDAKAAAFLNAAGFFGITDEPLAEQTLLHGQTLYPKDDRLPVSFGGLYASALVAAPDGSFAVEVRRKLDASRDAKLLAFVAQGLINSRTKPQGFDLVALGRSYAERAIQIGPDSLQGHLALASKRQHDLSRRRAEILSGVPPGAQPAKVAGLPEAERFTLLADLADYAYMSAEYNDFEAKRPDATYPSRWFQSSDEQERAALASWKQSKQYALDALALAPRFKDSPEYSWVFYHANINLGYHALREGDVKTSVTYLNAALTAPASEALAYDYSSLDARLATYLVRAGAREAVANFLDRSAELFVVGRDGRRRDAAAVRAGRMPTYMAPPR